MFLKDLAIFYALLPSKARSPYHALPCNHPHRTQTQIMHPRTHSLKQREREREMYRTLKAEMSTVYSALVTGI